MPHLVEQSKELRKTEIMISLCETIHSICAVVEINRLCRTNTQGKHLYLRQPPLSLEKKKSDSSQCKIAIILHFSLNCSLQDDRKKNAKYRYLKCCGLSVPNTQLIRAVSTVNVHGISYLSTCVLGHFLSRNMKTRWLFCGCCCDAQLNS